MSKTIVHSTLPVTLVGGGHTSSAEISEALALAPTCVAADGGLRAALAAGAMPEAVIGDFDSVAREDLSRLPDSAHHPVEDQESTDFEKALSRIAAPVVLAAGFLGARLDHQMAAMHVLTRHAGRPCILLGATEVTFLCPRTIDLDLAAGDTVSLFPMGEVFGRSEGLHWPIAGQAFDPLSRIGTSNRATGGVRLEMDAPRMLAMIPRAYLAAVTQALATLPQDARWSAP